MKEQSTLTVGNFWKAQELVDVIVKGLNVTRQYNSGDAVISFYDFNEVYELAVTDSGNHLHSVDIWLSPKGTNFLAVSIYSVLHHQGYTVADYNTIAARIAEESVRVLPELSWAEGFEGYVEKKNIANKNTGKLKVKNTEKINVAGNLIQLNSTRLISEFSRFHREAILGRTKEDRLDKVSL